MRHCVAEVRVLKEFEKEETMRVHYKFDVLRPLPVLQVLQVVDERLVLKVPILRQIVDVCGVGEAVEELELEEEALAAVVRVLVGVLRRWA